MSRPARTLAVAALVIAVAAVAAVALRRGNETYEVRAVLEQAHGLVPGARVTAAGLPVGEVSRIALGQDGRPRVTLRIEKRFRLRRGTRVDLRLVSNSGELNRAVALTRGSGTPLPDGAEIPRSRTSAPVELDAALATLAPRTRADVRALLRRLDGATNGLDDALAATVRRGGRALRNVALLTNDVNGDGDALARLLEAGRRIAAGTAKGRVALGSTARSLARSLTTVADRDRELRQTIARLPAGLGQVRATLVELDATAPRVERLATVATPGLRRLPATALRLRTAVVAATPALTSTVTLVRRAPASLRALDRLLQALGPALDHLVPALRRALRPLDVARVYTPELFGFLANWAGIETAYDAAGHAARLTPSVAPIPNHPVSLSSDAPGYTPAPYLRTPGALAGQPWPEYRASFLSEARR